MGVFHVFRIVQMVRNRAKRLICCSLFILTGKWGLSMFLLRLFLCSFYLKLRQKTSVSLVCVELTFFISYLAVPRQILGHWCGGSLTHLVLISASFVRPKCHREPRNGMPNDIFREVCMIGGRRYVVATFKSKLNVICNVCL